MDRPKLALVLGGAASVWCDAASAIEIAEPDAVYAVNDIGTRWSGPVAGWVTLHPEKMAAWRKERDQRGFAPAAEHVGYQAREGVDRVADYCWPEMGASGSSGLFAVKIALEAGFDRVILAGVPMAPAGAHFFNSAAWHECGSFTDAWTIVLPRIKSKVRSMSGWTAELLGKPDRNWLAG